MGHLLVPIDAWRRQREVQQVGGELFPCCRGGGAEPAVVGLGSGNDVLDVGLPDAFEPGPGVRAVDAAEFIDYPAFD